MLGQRGLNKLSVWDGVLYQSYLSINIIRKYLDIEQKNEQLVKCILYIYFIFTGVIFSPTTNTLPINCKDISIFFLNQVENKRFCCITNNPKISLGNKTKSILCMCNTRVLGWARDLYLCCYSGADCSRLYKSKKVMAGYTLTLHHLISSFLLRFHQPNMTYVQLFLPRYTNKSATYTGYCKSTFLVSCFIYSLLHLKHSPSP